VSRYLANERRTATAPKGSEAPSIDFHRRLPGYAPTPVLDLTDELASQLGVGRVLLKDERQRFGLPAFKMLGASWAVYRAVRERAGLDDQPSADDPFEELRGIVHAAPPFGLAAATDGNHGRAVARMAAMLGLPCSIYVPAGTADARIAAIEHEGATVTVVDGTYDDAVATSADVGSEWLVVSDTSWPGYETIPRWVVDGYATIAHELHAQLPLAPDAVVVPLGVGALGAAIAAAFPGAPGEAPFLLGVEPDVAACVLAAVEAGEVVEVPGPHRSIMAGLNCGTASRIALPAIIDRYDAIVTVSDERCGEALRSLAAAGVDCGECGAAPLAGVAAAVGETDRLHERSTVVLLCTEGVTDPAGFARIVGRPAQLARA